MEIISRSKAQAEGLKRYYTGKPCKKGHISERYTCSGECWQCRQEWRAANRDKTNEVQNKQRELERAGIAASAKAKKRRRELVLRHRSIAKERVAALGRACPLYLTYKDKLVITDGANQGDFGELLVACYKCGEEFIPDKAAVSKRVAAIEGRIQGESNFYCSNECKGSCSVYRSHGKIFSPHSIAKTKQARYCQEISKKLLLRKQVKENCYNYCERCGVEPDSLHLHHTILSFKKPREVNIK